MTDLPKGWMQAALGDVTAIRREKQDPRRLPNLPFIGLEEVEAHTGRIISTRNTSTLASAVALFSEGDVLYGRLRPYLNKVVIPNFGGAASAEFIVLTGSELLDTRYLQRVLMSPDFVSFTALRSTGDRPRVSYETIRTYTLPLPPIGEQRRIVAKIDSLFAKSKRACDQLDHIPRMVEKYKQAILSVAYEDAQQRSERECTLKSISVEVRNGLSKKPSEDQSGFPILRISAVRPLTVRLEDIRYYPTTETVPDSAKLREGDLLFTRYNGNPEFTAVCGMVRCLTRATLYPDKLIRVRLADAADPGFIEIICSAPQSRDWLAPHIKSAAGQHGISGGDLKRLPIFLPTIAEQRQIAHRTATALSWVDRLGSEATSARKLLDYLDQAVLAKAFRGELVPQGPNDEPVSVLLERIKAQSLISSQKSGTGHQKEAIKHGKAAEQVVVAD